jgi:hypothetical protein
MIHIRSRIVLERYEAHTHIQLFELLVFTPSQSSTTRRVAYASPLAVLGCLEETSRRLQTLRRSVSTAEDCTRIVRSAMLLLLLTVCKHFFGVS